MRERTCGAVLAGGAATRLGGLPKGLLRIGGERIVDRSLRLLAELCSETILVANDPAPYEGVQAPIVGDRPERRRASGPLGPLAGLEAALGATRAEFVLVVACDMPAVRPELLRLLRDAPAEADVVVPVVAERHEPLCARYARICAPAISRALDEQRLFATSFYGEVRVLPIGEAELRVVDPDLVSFENANTPEQARALGLEIPEPRRPGP